jgi:glycosyltransferase involved in cell wall biosynthesis
MHKSLEICIACHGQIDSNSGRHVVAIAKELAGVGFRVTVCVPIHTTDKDLECYTFKVYSFSEYLASTEVKVPGLVYLWTPRNLMVNFYESLCLHFKKQIPYVVHLEDNESILFLNQTKVSDAFFLDILQGRKTFDVPGHLAHPFRAKRFMLSARGVTALVDTLVDGLPDDLPKAVFWPGYDKAFEKYSYLDRLRLRSRLGIQAGFFVTSYTGNVHPSNIDEVRSLYIAVAIVNRMGLPLKLLRTGVDFVTPLAEHGSDILQEHVIPLGMVPLEDLPTIVHSADILVQPGRVDDWNRFRVPSKLPEFLASCRPVILPRVNLGLALEHGKNAIIVNDATAEAIAASLLEWLPQKKQRHEIGIRGGTFARRELSWSVAGDKVARLLRTIMNPD